MNKLSKKICALLQILLLSFASIFPKDEPDLTVIFVIDQFAYHYIDKLKPHLDGAIKFFIDNGVFFQEAHYPHANSETAPGHTTMSTGTLAKKHGIIGNKWFDESGNKVFCDDNGKSSLVFFKKVQRKSSSKIMTDGICNQAVLKNYKAFTVSIKSRSAICVANKLGKAIWFDTDEQKFTSSKAYFNSLPSWVDRFNNAQLSSSINNKNSGFIWTLSHPQNKQAYAFDNIRNYQFSSQPPLAERKVLFSEKMNIVRTPLANRWLLNLAKECIQNNLSADSRKEKLLLWVLLSPLDLAAHIYGPESLEAIDIIYHLDHDIAKFMNWVKKVHSNKKVLYALTADHGVLPIPELLAKKGLKARRIDAIKLMNELNKILEQRYKVQNLVIGVEASQFYFDQKKLLRLGEKKNEVLTDAKKFLEKQEGISEVWTFNELKGLKSKKNSLNRFYQNQLYSGRSGEIICKVKPYTLLTEHQKGTNHASPYEYDTHVPLMIYQKGRFEKKKISQKVWMPQLASTIAKILGIPAPKDATYGPLF